MLLPPSPLHCPVPPPAASHLHARPCRRVHLQKEIQNYGVACVVVVVEFCCCCLSCLPCLVLSLSAASASASLLLVSACPLKCVNLQVCVPVCVCVGVSVCLCGLAEVCVRCYLPRQHRQRSRVVTERTVGPSGNTASKNNRNCKFINI